MLRGPIDEDHRSSASDIRRAALKPAEVATRPLRWIVRILYIIVVFGVTVILIYGGFYVVTNYLVKSGEGVSQVKHGTVAVEEPAKGIKGFLRSAPGISKVYNAIVTPEQPVVSFESDVQSNKENKNLGVKIVQFSDLKKFNRPGEDLEITGSIQASSLQDETKLQVFCKMENYEQEALKNAEVLGGRASGNEVTLYKDENTFFNFNCIFPNGIPADKMKRPKETRFVTAVVVYEFLTKATQKIYFFPRQTIDSLERSGTNPFDYYSVDDPQLSSDRKIKSISTAGPLNLGLAVDFPQPLTSNPNSVYQLFVQISNNPGFSGNLQNIKNLEVQVPDVSELNIALQGEPDFGLGSSSACDFEYVGPGEEGFKLYRLKPEKLDEVNRECSSKSLKELALSEQQCIDLFKRPIFRCKFRVNRVPESGLQFDTIRATADYTYEIDRRTAVDVYKLPELQAVA